MSHISRFKFENLRIAENASRHMSNKLINCKENSLVLLENQGGKSSLVTCLLQPIILVDRKNIGSKANKVTYDLDYKFTYTGPSYILVEFLHKNNKTRILTGIGIEKKGREFLKRAFVSVYDSPNEYSIENMSFSEVREGAKYIKGVEQVHEELKNASKGNPNLFVFNPSNSRERMEHTNLLLRYEIDVDYWTNLMVQINAQEGSISDMFHSKAPTSKDFIECYILPQIDAKLQYEDNEKSNIEYIQSTIMEHIRLNQKYQKDVEELNQNIELKNNIVELRDFQILIRQDQNEIYNVKNYLANLCEYIEELYIQNRNKAKENDNDIYILDLEMKELLYQKESYKYNKKSEELQEFNIKLEEIINSYYDINKPLAEKNNKLHILECKKYLDDINDNERELGRYNTELQKKQMNIDEESKMQSNVMASIYNLMGKDISAQNNIIKQKNQELQILENKKNSNKLEIDAFKKELEQLRVKKDDVTKVINRYKDRFEDYRNEYKDYIEDFLIDGTLNMHYLEDRITKKNKIIAEGKQKIKENENLIEQNNVKVKENNSLLENLYKEIEINKVELSKAENEYNGFSKQHSQIIHFMKNINIEKIFDKEKVINTLNSKKEGLENSLKEYIKQKNDFIEKKNFFESNTTKAIEEVGEILNKNNIPYVVGKKYLDEAFSNIEAKRNAYNKNQLIPLSLIVSKNELEKIKKIDFKSLVGTVCPILIKEEILDKVTDTEGYVTSINNMSFINVFNEELLDLEYIEEQKKKISEKIFDIDKYINKLEQEKDGIVVGKEIYNKFIETYSEESEFLLSNNIENIKNDIKETKDSINLLKRNNENLTNVNRDLSNENKKLSENNSMTEKEVRLLEPLRNNYGEYIYNFSNLKEIEQKDNKIKKLLDNKEKEISSIFQSISKVSIELQQLKDECEKNKKEQEKYKSDEGEMLNYTLSELKGMYEGFNKQDSFKHLDELKRKIGELKNKSNELKIGLQGAEERHKISRDEYFAINYSIEEKIELEKNVDKLTTELKPIGEAKILMESEINGLNKELDSIKKLINETYSKGVCELKDMKNTNFVEWNKKINTKKQMLDVLEIKLNKEETELKLLGSILKEKYQNCKFEKVDISLCLEEIQSVIRSKEEEIHNYNKNIDNKILLRNDVIIKTKRLVELDNSKKQAINRLVECNELEPYDNCIESIQCIIDRSKHNVESLYKSKENLIQNTKEYVKNINNQFVQFNSKAKINGKSLMEIEFDNLEPIMSNVELNINRIIEENSFQEREGDIKKAIEKEITMYNLIDWVRNIKSAQVKVRKYYKGGERLIRYEAAKEVGGELCGSQSILSNLAILSSLRKYVSSFNKDTGKFTLITDNPFGKITTDDIVSRFMDLVKTMNIHLICFTDIDLASITNKFEYIYSFKIVQYNNGKSKIEVDSIVEEEEKYEESEINFSFFPLIEK
jgi:hypothetical protein